MINDIFSEQIVPKKNLDYYEFITSHKNAILFYLLSLLQIPYTTVN